MTKYQSWGKHFNFNHIVQRLYDRSESFDFLKEEGKSVLPYGYGRSYGDSCLNDDNILLDISGLNHFIAFDKQAGVLRCEAGVTLADILELTVAEGWFIPVTPGTKFVSIGGAISNDVHGKNHHQDGTFGRHVRRFELLRSNGDRIECSPEENTEYFQAAIGGLGLVGVIIWAEIQLVKITSAFIDQETIKFSSLDEFTKLATESDQTHRYTVAWIDTLAKGEELGRGLFIRGNHVEGDLKSLEKERGRSLAPPISIPTDLPGFMLNNWSAKTFNALYYAKQREAKERKNVFYDGFFYPLDKIGHWNRVYGKKGVFQYQFVLPFVAAAAIKEILLVITKADTPSFLAVLKHFGSLESPGILSFPKPGITLALDFPNRGYKTIDVMRRLDDIVLQNQGRLYPAKDSIMDAETFRTCYPEVDQFTPFIDPKFSSSFWRRVMKS